VPNPPPTALKAQRQTFDRIIWRISNFTESFAHCKSKIGEQHNLARNIEKIHSLLNKPATIAVEDMANSVANIIHSSFQIALRICDKNCLL